MKTQTQSPYRILLSPPHMSGRERKYVDEVFATNFVAPAGPILSRFEQMFCERTGFSHAVAVSSGTAALHLALRCAGVERGDRVWAPTFTFIASIAPIIYQGATPVLFDCDAHSWNIDLGLVEEELKKAAQRNELPKAIIAVDLYGMPCDLEHLKAIAASYEVAVIADSAEAIGSRREGKHAGFGADCAAFSFNGNKLITTGGGGLLASEDEKLVEYARFLSQQARAPVLHYEHEEIGYNYRMSSINAAVGCGQLEVLEERVTRRREIFENYRKSLGSLPGIRFPDEPAGARANRWLSVLTTNGRPDLAKFILSLNELGIEARRLWKPMHLQGALKGVNVIGGSVAERLFETGLCLPSGTDMTKADEEFVATAVKKIVSEIA
ncbi:DegT/DnrJ/EryC1/StrS aminotransferase [Tepidicaulis marinus]|uniref:DegT/DnrJ/EryC1/StrS aminotransferase n=1 Tax=Tepidicaulis marinus TaxID=1333998 RepID=A0A081BDN9_9HYPH|nr:aminotransferase class I/II-fold pyridoxal phosphate-dependent enzyme [Tepidicaulis marinus]GAK46157.1 DegT/DnrJ/EryC1/StrS aminotransferase [Tepidicaulis marinus]